MLRRGLAAFAVTLAVASLAWAGSYVGLVTKVSDSEITFRVRKDPKDKKSDFTEEKKVKLGKGTKYQSGPASKDAEPTDLSLDDVKKAVEAAVGDDKRAVKGVLARIDVKGEGKSEEVSRVVIFPGKGK
jgi:hypothetical protein